MPPTLGKLKGHIACFRLVRVCVRPSFCASVTKFIKIQFVISYKDSSSKNNGHIFFKSGLSPFVEL